MSDLPDFSTERDLVEWFEQADLSAYELHPAEVVVEPPVTLTISDSGEEATSSGTTGNATLVVVRS